jgi:hypothetical protein
MYTIATLHDIRQHLNLADSDTSSDDDLLKALQQASHVLESLTNRRYCPAIESRVASIDTANPTDLILPDDLLSLSSLTNGDGGSINLGDVQTVPSHADLPTSVLHLINGVSFIYSESPINAVSIAGTWGWHDRWTKAWRDSSDTVQDNPLSDSATALTVTDADGVDSDGFSPRFQVGHLLQIESEYLRVIAVNTTTNQLTVQRGVNGTTASSHVQTTTIDTYQPVPAIRDLCVRYAELLFNSIGIFDTDADPLVARLRRLTA